MKWKLPAVLCLIAGVSHAELKGKTIDYKEGKTISMLEFDGVALAALQGLNQKLEEKDVEIQALKQSVAELKQLVSQLTRN